MTLAEKEIRNQEIVSLRKQGRSMSDLADLYNLTLVHIHNICKRYGVSGVMADMTVKNPRNQYTSGNFDREAYAEKYVSSIDGYEYVGNYTGSDGYVDIRCKKCGHVQTKSAVSIRHARKDKRIIACPVCAAAEREQKKEAAEQERKIKREAEKKRERERKRLERFLNQPFTQMEFKTCPVCNKVFYGKSLYCSARCKENNKWKLKDGYRYSFPLEEVYERDNGVCYLCGGLCDWNDWEERDGVIVYGNLYPSRDHVIPKSHGGQNAWENIRLAHRICNSIKHDRPLGSFKGPMPL